MPDQVTQTPRKTPRLRSIYEELQVRKAPLAAEREKVRARLDELTQSDEVNRLRKRMKELNAELFPIDNELAALARGLGVKASLAAGPGGHRPEGGDSQ